MKPRRPKKPSPNAAFTRRLMPPTYEKLLAQLMREHPEYSQAEIEAAIAEVARRATPPTKGDPHGDEGQ